MSFRSPSSKCTVMYLTVPRFHLPFLTCSFLNCADRFKHWPISIPVVSTSIKTIAEESFSSGYLLSVFRPQLLQTSSLLLCKQIHTTANELLKCFHRQRETSINSNRFDLKWGFLFQSYQGLFKQALKQDILTNTTEIVFGTTLPLSGGFLHTDLEAIGSYTFVQYLISQM